MLIGQRIDGILKKYDVLSDHKILSNHDNDAHFSRPYTLIFFAVF